MNSVLILEYVHRDFLIPVIVVNVANCYTMYVWYVKNKFLLSVITSIFSKMEWDCSTKGDTLDSSLGLAENNIMSYLGLTEDKTTELLSIQAFLNSKVNT